MIVYALMFYLCVNKDECIQKLRQVADTLILINETDFLCVFSLLILLR